MLALSAWSLLAEPWAEPFMLRALAEVVLVGVTCGALGCWVVVHGLSYGAESLAHAMLPGLVLGALLGLPLLVGAAAGLGVAAVAVALAARVPGVDRDPAVGVAVTGLLGLGALLALSRDTPPGIQGLLFGDVLAVSRADLLVAGAVTAAVLACLAVAHRRLLAVGFDRAAARSLGVRALAADATLMGALAGAILVGVQGLGNLLVVAVLIAPAAAARLLAQRMAAMMALSAGIAVAGGIGGLYISFYARTAAGASIAAVLVAVFFVAAAVAVARRRLAPAGAGARAS